MPSRGHDTLFTEIEQLLTTIAARDVEKLIRRGLEFSFEEIEPRMREAQLISKAALAVKDIWPIAGEETLEKDMSAGLREYVKQLDRLAAYQSSVENPGAHLNRLVDDFNASYRKLFDFWCPFLTYSRFRAGGGVEERKLLAELQRHADGATSSVNATRALESEATRILESIQASAGKVGIQSYAAFFQGEAATHTRVAKIWLGFTVAALIVSVLYAYSLLRSVDQPKIVAAVSAVEVVHTTVVRVLLLSLLSYGVLFCARSYRAHRHNVIVNRHRMNSLNTFQAFSEAAHGDEAARSAVLLHAAQSIFCAQSTGYTTSEADQDQPSRIVEILRKVGSTDK